jgi:hypothetical protein
MATSPTSSQAGAEVRLNQFVEGLRSQRAGSDVAFLKKVFHQTEKTFLKKYDPYSDFNQIFASGTYDCLTATSLFSNVLDQLNFTYRIMETNYHIFLLVRTSDGEVLLETTDRFQGFVRRSDEIGQRINSYRHSMTPRATENKDIYLYHCDLYREVNHRQLPGLLYYNQAIKAYNTGRLEQCADLLEKAKSVYDTPRISEFARICLQLVVSSQLDDPTKQRLIHQLKDLVQEPATLASR